MPGWNRPSWRNDRAAPFRSGPSSSTSPAKALGCRAREEPTGVTLEAIETRSIRSQGIQHEPLKRDSQVRRALREKQTGRRQALLRRMDKARTVVPVDTHILALFAARFEVC